MSTEYNEGGTDEFVIGSRGRLSCESCARCNQRIADLESQLAAVRPVVEAAVLYAKYNDIDSGRDLMDAVSDYEARKPK